MADSTPDVAAANLQGVRVVWATRGGERAPFYQFHLMTALEEAGADVEIVGLKGLVKQAASDIGARATDLLESAKGRLAEGLRIDRLLGGDSPPDDTPTDQPTIVLIDSPRLAAPARAAFAIKESDTLMVGLVDDLSVDTAWRHAPIDAIIVPHPDLQHALVDPDGQVAVETATIPTNARLRGDETPQSARENLGLDPEQGLVLVSTGGMRDEALERAVFQLTMLEGPERVLFHYGKHAEVADRLRRSAAGYGLQAGMFGDEADLAVVCAAADVILAGASDPSVPELVQARRPLVLVGRDGGAARALFLADNGALIHVEDVAELGARLDVLLRDPAVSVLVERASAIIPPDGVEKVVAALGALHTRRATILAHTAPTPVADQPATPETPPGEPTQPAVKSPFESIGASAPGSGPSPALAPISLAEAKDQMARLIVREREAERALAEVVKTRDRWLDRIELARDSGDDDLLQVAQARLTGARTEVTRFNSDIETIRRAKTKLKERVAARRQPTKSRPAAKGQDSTAPAQPAPPDVEARFRKMELDREMERLRRKIRGKS